MNKEIGSEFWLTKVPIKHMGSSPEWINVWGNNILTSSGRGAISLMLKQLKDKVISKTVLLPVYTCESVIMPFIKGGYTCCFYDIDYDLKPNTESMKKYVKSDIGIFLHMGYFGFSTNDNLHGCISYLKKKGTIIVEDVTHTLFSQYERYTENDYYIASLRKWIGVPSGGFLASKDNDVQCCLDEQSVFSSIREEALLLKGDYIKSNNQELKQKFLSIFNKAENILYDDLKPYTIDDTSNSIINEVDIRELIIKRKENFIFLLKALEDTEGIEPVFSKISDNICPLFFPVYLGKERERFRKFLIDESIYCPVHWLIPEQMNISNYSLSKKIYDSILSIPCDQRYDVEDMKRIVSVINNYEGTE